MADKSLDIYRFVLSMFRTKEECMSFEEASAALANFTSLHNQYREKCDLEAIRAAEKAAADAELSLAVSARESADTAAEQALAVLLQALANVGINAG